MSDIETKAPDTVRVEANKALVVEVLEMSTTFPVIAGVVTAVEYVGAKDMAAISPDTAVPVAADWVRDAVSILPDVYALDVEVNPIPVPVVRAPVVNEKLVPVASSLVAAISPAEMVRSPSVKVMFPVVKVRELVSAPAPATVINPVPRNPKVGLVVALPKFTASVSVDMAKKLLAPSEMVNTEATALSISISFVPSRVTPDPPVILIFPSNLLVPASIHKA